MKKKFSKIIMLLAALLIISFAFVSIATAASTHSGKCGANLKWSLNEKTYTLTISGKGDMKNWQYLDDDKRGWNKYNSRIHKVVIKKGCTRIGSYAFKNCTKLTSITIPSSVTKIGEGAFDTCTKLTSVKLPSSIKNISVLMFNDCHKLANITIPNSVTKISDLAFDGCSNLKSINIPKSVTKIGSGIFAHCDNLSSVTVDEGNKVFDSRNNCNAIINTKNNALKAGCPKTIIPDDVIRIENEAFSKCTNLASIDIPDSVTSIGHNAFYGCDDLKSITIPKSVQSIDFQAFGSCNKLKTVTFLNNVPTMGTGIFSYCSNLTNVTLSDNTTSISDCMFRDCSNLTSITIPDSVTRIDRGAFDGCKKLKEINIPGSVKTIGQDAFAYCDSLTSITIPSSVTRIYGNAFAACNNIKSIKVDEGNTVYDSRDNCNAIIKTATNCLITGCSETIIPDGVTSIGASAFFSCEGLKDLVIPTSVTSIGSSAFYCCYDFKVIYPGTQSQWAKVQRHKVYKNITYFGSKQLGISKQAVTIKHDNRAQLELFHPDGVKINWKSSNQKVATVDLHGFVTAKAVGKATITAYYVTAGTTYKVTCKVTVPAYMNKTKVKLKKGSSKTLKVVGSRLKKTWTSSKKSVATVSSSGKVKAKKAGTATITCKLSNGKKYKCKVIVK